MTTSINRQEINHFAKDSLQWWDESGPFAPLHRLNPTRMRYICEQIKSYYRIDSETAHPFNNLKILDIGCGGGLICEPLARLGADMTGVDADANAVAIAKAHAKQNNLKIAYQEGAAEDLSKKFDVVLALEIAEHVDHVDQFVQNCIDLCKPDGLIIFSTLNRTPQSYALGIIAAEHILRWVPRGTHQWRKFIRPSEFARMIRHAGGEACDITGLRYNPVKRDFEMSDKDMSINYFIAAKKT